MHSAGTARTCWFWGAILGLCVWLGVWWISGLGWAAGLFLGAVAMVVTALALDWLWLQGVPAVDASAYAPTRTGVADAGLSADAVPAAARLLAARGSAGPAAGAAETAPAAPDNRRAAS